MYNQYKNWDILHFIPQCVQSNVCCNPAASQFQSWIFHVLGDQEGRVTITCQGKGRLQHFSNFIVFLKNVFDGFVIFCIVWEVMIFKGRDARGRMYGYMLWCWFLSKRNACMIIVDINWVLHMCSCLSVCKNRTALSWVGYKIAIRS